MSKTIALGIAISALGGAATASAIGSVSDRVASLGRTIGALESRRQGVLGAMYKEWVSGGNAVKQYAAEVDRLDGRIRRLAENRTRLEALGAQHAKNRADMNSRIGDVVAAYGVGRTLRAPVAAFLRQDEALADLRVAMMDKNGQVGESYGQLRRQVVELGNLLPGTTADFAGTATALMEQGVALQSVLGGGLKAAANLSIVLKMPADQAGEMTAKLREAYKLSDDELVKMADTMQRAKFAFGMKPGDLMAASAYQAPILNQLGITGLANTNKMLAVQGMAAQVGLEGSSFGTNFSTMLQRLSKGPEMIEQGTRGMKGHAKELMDSVGVTFDFFDKKGNFAGIDHMVAELEKLKLIKDKLGDKAAMDVADAMFGAEAGRPALILAEAGMAGFRAAQDRMAQQASLEQRIKEITESSRATIEALGGSMENLGSALAGPAIKSLHPLINLLNTATGALTDFTERHPVAAKWIGLAAGSVLGLTASFLGMGAALSMVRFAWTGAQLLPGLGMLTKALPVARTAVLAFGRALWTLVANPIGATIAAIAVGALLIYKYWGPISSWFRQAWADVKAEFAKVWPFFQALPGRFRDWGASLLTGLIDGIKAKATAAKEAVIGVGREVAQSFKSVLGIHSPSRVFHDMGGQIGAGMQLGMLGTIPGVRSAGNKLAAATLAGAMAVHGGPSLAAAGQLPAGGGQAMHITYAPVINVQGGDAAATRKQVDQALKLSQVEFEKMLDRARQNRARKGF